MVTRWTCPKCGRQFARPNQRHACGVGDRSSVLRNRSPGIVQLYGALETFAESLGEVEVVTRERYVLLRSVRIFADLVIGPDAIRVAIHLPRKTRHRLFTKVVSQRRHVTHVAKIRDLDDLESMRPFLRKAFDYSVGNSSSGRAD